MARKTPSASPRDLPAYTILEAAHYLGVSGSTIRYWSVGRPPHKPLIQIPDLAPDSLADSSQSLFRSAASRTPVLLSFLNLAELHVLAAIRRQHVISMPKIRKAIQYLAEHVLPPEERRHPLISADLETDKANLFIQQYGELINISQGGQTAMRKILQAALQRIERDSNNIPVKLHPFTRVNTAHAPAMITIEPGLSFGRPVISGTGIATEIVAERYKAGESIEELARDYARSKAEIEEAVRCELQLAA